MVLSSPAAHDPVRPETGWLEAVLRTLRLSKGGVLVHVDHATPARLGELAKALFAEWPDLDVLDGVSGLDTAPSGSTRVLVPRAEEATWLNLNRPIVARRGLKLVLFCDHATTIELSRRAPDFFDWVSAHVECPEGPAPFALEGIRAAILTGAPGIHWTSGIDEAAKKTAVELLLACSPETVVRWVDVEGPYPEVVTRLQRVSEPGEWLGCAADEQWKVWRFRWACAEAQRDPPTLVLTPGLDCPGFWPVHDRILTLSEGRELLADARLTRPGLLAALLQLEPEAIGFAAQLLIASAAEHEVLQAISAASDPGATLVRGTSRGGAISAPSAPSTLRARAMRAPVARSHPGRDVEETLRLGSEDNDWSYLTYVAGRIGDKGAEEHWRARSVGTPSSRLGRAREGSAEERATREMDKHRQQIERWRVERTRSGFDPERAERAGPPRWIRDLLPELIEEATQHGVSTEPFARLVARLAGLYRLAGAPHVAIPLLIMVLAPVDPGLGAALSAGEPPELFPFLDREGSARLQQLLPSFAARKAPPEPETVVSSYSDLHVALHAQGRHQEADALLSSWNTYVPPDKGAASGA